MRNNFLKSVAAGLSLALVVTSVNLPVNTASAAKKYRVVEKAVLSAAKKIDFRQVYLLLHSICRPPFNALDFGII